MEIANLIASLRAPGCEESLCSDCKPNRNAKRCLLSEKAADALEAAHALEVMPKETRWIPVTERVPEKGIDCLCRCVVKDMDDLPFYMVLRYILVDRNPHFQHETMGGMKVTHWKPLFTLEEALDDHFLKGTKYCEEKVKNNV